MIFHSYVCLPEGIHFFRSRHIVVTIPGPWPSHVPQKAPQLRDVRLSHPGLRFTSNSHNFIACQGCHLRLVPGKYLMELYHHGKQYLTLVLQYIYINK
jgi:hypothetical protein